MSTKETSVTTIDDAPAKTAAPRAKTLAVPDAGHTETGDETMSGDKMEVTIHAGEGEAGQQAVFLSINGNGLLFPRGVPCVVPVEVVEILDNATQIVYQPGEGGKMIEREIKRFSYTAKSVRK